MLLYADFISTGKVSKPGFKSTDPGRIFTYGNEHIKNKCDNKLYSLTQGV